MSELEEWEKLNNMLGYMVSHFTNLVKAARIPDDEATEQKKSQGEILEVFAEKLVNSAQKCLEHVAELRKNAVLSDSEQQLNDSNNSRYEFKKASDFTDNTLTRIKVEGEQLLRMMEESYYSSHFKGRLPELPRSSQLDKLIRLAVESGPKV